VLRYLGSFNKERVQKMIRREIFNRIVEMFNKRSNTIHDLTDFMKEFVAFALEHPEQENSEWIDTIKPELCAARYHLKRAFNSIYGLSGDVDKR